MPSRPSITPIPPAIRGLHAAFLERAGMDEEAMADPEMARMAFVAGVEETLVMLTIQSQAADDRALLDNIITTRNATAQYWRDLAENRRRPSES